MTGYMSFELLFYGGIAVMLLAGVFFIIQTIVFLVNRIHISRKLDEEYGQPQKYNRKSEGEQIWP